MQCLLYFAHNGAFGGLYLVTPVFGKSSFASIVNYEENNFILIPILALILEITCAHIISLIVLDFVGYIGGHILSDDLRRCAEYEDFQRQILQFRNFLQYLIVAVLTVDVDNPVLLHFGDQIYTALAATIIHN